MIVILIHTVAIPVCFIDDLDAGDLETSFGLVGEEPAALYADVEVGCRFPELSPAAVGAGVVGAISSTR
jgi:hypothetical protein